MDAFNDKLPVTVAVAWLPKSGNNPGELALLNHKQLPDAIVGETVDQASQVVTRWLVPWTSVVYLKQDQPAPVIGDDPVKPGPPSKRPVDPGPKGK